jgi:hypothetical protein
MADLRPDIAGAAAAMRGKLNRAWGRALPLVEHNLEPCEKVLRLASGVRGGIGVTSERILMVLTDRKILFMHQGIVRSSQESIPLDLITGVAVKKEILWSNIKTTGAQSDEIITQVNKADAEAMVGELKSLLARRMHSSQIVSSPESSTSVAEELERLVALRNQGVLTGDEFSVQKSRLLAG